MDTTHWGGGHCSGDLGGADHPVAGTPGGATGTTENGGLTLGVLWGSVAIFKGILDQLGSVF